MVERSDLDLLKQAQASTPEGAKAFHELVDRHAAAMHRLALTLLPVGRRSDAEDLVQETFLAAYRGMGSFEGRSSVKTWLYGILFRQAALVRRRLGLAPMVQLAEDVGGRAVEVASEVGRADARMDLHSALARLPEELRAILVLREFDGLAYEEIGGLLGIPKGTVESRLHRARQALKAILLPSPERSGG